MSDENREKELRTENKNRVPIRDAGIGTRISEASQRIGTRKKAADAAGITTDQLARYIRGDNEPRFTAMIRLCKAAGIDPIWLATGEGSPQATIGTNEGPASYASTTASIAADWQLLSDIMEGIDAALDEQRKTMKSKKKLELARLVYDMYSESGKQPARETVLRLVRSAS